MLGNQEGFIMIGFPGIGPGNGYGFEHNPIIFSIGNSFALHWYALILVAGLLLAVMYCLRQTKHFGIRQDDVYDMLFCAVPAAVIGARLYYVAFNWSDYSADPKTILFTWQGGLAIYGAIIGAVIATVIFCRIRRVSAGAMLDLGAMGLLIGQAIGRWGNFVNGEIYGTATKLPWRMRVEPPVSDVAMDVHPLFLYESLWCVLGLAVLIFFMKKRKYNGQMFTLYAAWYGLGRAVLEGMRDPEYNLMLGGTFDPETGEMVGQIMFSQVFAGITCVAAMGLLFYMTMFKKHPPILEWTAARDEHEKLRNAKKGISNEDTGDAGEPSDETQNPNEATETDEPPNAVKPEKESETEASEEEAVKEEAAEEKTEPAEGEAADNGNSDGREESGEND
jgi:phosphatidylglycerol:prolipoprotein diacylglycerol transferase